MDTLDWARHYTTLLLKGNRRPDALAFLNKAAEACSHAPTSNSMYVGLAHSPSL